MFLEVDQWIVLALVTTIGAVLGSFFNVVIYRWPMGRSIVYPPSSCPKCGQPIKLRHNIPVLGWFLLRGKCYECGASISPRYPLIETLSAASFAALAWVEPVGMGVNLPVDLEFAEVAPSLPDLYGIMAFHATLLSGLLIAAGIDFDRHRVPRSLPIWLVLIALAASLYRASFLPVIAFESLPVQLEQQRGAIGWITSLYGAIAGMVFGCLLAPASSLGRSGAEGRWAALMLTTLLGAFVGWQAVGTITASCAIVYAVAIILRHGIPPLQGVTFPLLLWVGTLVWLLGWRWFDAQLPSGSFNSVKLIVAQGSTILAAASVAYLLRGPALSPPPGVLTPPASRS